jgi:hypothetical protein
MQEPVLVALTAGLQGSILILIEVDKRSSLVTLVAGDLFVGKFPRTHQSGE